MFEGWEMPQNKRMELTSHSCSLDPLGRLAAQPQCSTHARKGGCFGAGVKGVGAIDPEGMDQGG